MPREQSAFQDPADFNTASAHDHPIRGAKHHDFLRQFCEEHELSQDGIGELEAHVDAEASRLMGERFVRLIQFFEQCRIPKLVVFATLATRGNMQMVDIAAQCGVSKQAIHKAFRAMEPAFKKYGKGYEHRRNFTQQPNEIEQHEEAEFEHAKNGCGSEVAVCGNGNHR